MQAQFGRTAAHYKTSTVHATGADLTQLHDYLSQQAARRVLDVGCGAGHASMAAASAVAAVVPLDITFPMLQQTEALAAERGYSQLAPTQADGGQMPFQSETFDAVISRYSAHHWPQPPQVLAECLRVLRPGGLLLLIDVVSAEDAATDTLLQTIELLRDGSHVRDHTVSQWQTMLTQVGATVSAVSTWALPIVFNDWTERMTTPPHRVALIRELLAAAPEATCEWLQHQPNDDFSLQSALIVAHKPPLAC